MSSTSLITALSEQPDEPGLVKALCSGQAKHVPNPHCRQPADVLVAMLQSMNMRVIKALIAGCIARLAVHAV